ncbi:MAG: hypothetical protein PF447_11835 [Spirochaetaceae bacterium]|nr:hypothetical protein [Spirochaetaceae bacterium]
MNKNNVLSSTKKCEVFMLKKALFLLAALSLVMTFACQQPGDTISNSTSNYTLATPSVTVNGGDGWVEVTWNPVAEADYYEIYRMAPDTGYQLIGTSDNDDSHTVSRAAYADQSDFRRTNFIDRVGITTNNLFAFSGSTGPNFLQQDVSYRYGVVARNDDTVDNNVTGVAQYLDSNMGVSSGVTLTSVPAKGSILEAPTNVSLQYYALMGTEFYTLNWDYNNLAGGYMVFGMDANDAIVLSQYEEEDGALNYALSMDPIDIDPDTVGLQVLTVSSAIRLSSADIGTYVGFTVIAIPFDEYFNTFGYAGSSNELIAGIETINATTDHESEIVVNWESIDDADYYELWRKGQDEATWSQMTDDTTDQALFIEQNDGDDVYFVDEDAALIAGTNEAYTYHYKVRAVFVDNSTDPATTTMSVFSPLAQGDIAYTVVDELALTTPVVTATNGEFTNKIEITWPVVDDATDYILYRAESTVNTGNNGDYVQIATTADFSIMETQAGLTNDVLYEDTDVLPQVTNADGSVDNQYYYYYVIAVTGTVYSDESNADLGWVVPNTGEADPVLFINDPTAVTYSAAESNASSIAIEWTAVTTLAANAGAVAADSYDFYVSSATATTEYVLLAEDVTSTNFTDLNGASIEEGDTLRASLSATGVETTLVQGESYFIKIRAKNTANNLVSELSASDTSRLRGFVSPSASGAYAAGAGEIQITFTETTNEFIEQDAGQDAYIIAYAADGTAIANTYAPLTDLTAIGGWSGTDVWTDTTVNTFADPVIGDFAVAETTINGGLATGDYDFYIITRADNGEYGTSNVINITVP